MRAEVASLNHCAVPFLSRAITNSYRCYGTDLYKGCGYRDTEELKAIVLELYTFLRNVSFHYVTNTAYLYQTCNVNMIRDAPTNTRNNCRHERGTHRAVKRFCEQYVISQIHILPFPRLRVPSAVTFLLFPLSLIRKPSLKRKPVDSVDVDSNSSEIRFLSLLCFSQKQLPRKMKLHLVIIECAGYIFWLFAATIVGSTNVAHHCIMNFTPYTSHENNCCAK